MAVTEVGTPTAAVFATGNAGSVTGTFSGTQTDTAGDLIVASVLAFGTTTAGTISTPASWTKVYEQTSGDGRCRVAQYWLKAAGSDTLPAFTATMTGTSSSARMACYIQEFTGQDGTTPVVTSGSGTSTITPITITTSGNVPVAGCFGAAWWCAVTTSNGAVGFTPSSGWANESNNAAATTLRPHYAADTQSNPSHGSTLAETQSISGGLQETTAGLIVIQPPVAATPSGTVQPRATVPVPRRRPARAYVRSLAVPGITGIAPVQQFRLAPRRTPARAYVQFIPVRTVNATAPPPVNGTVQPLATIPVARRRPARAYIRFTPVPGGLPPNGTVQPRATISVPRRVRVRAYVKFIPVPGVNALPPPPGPPPAIPTSGGTTAPWIRTFRSIEPGDVPASGAQLPKMHGRAFTIPVPTDTGHAVHAWETAEAPPPAGPDIITAAIESAQRQLGAAGTKALDIGRIFADPPYEHHPKTCGAIRKIGGVTLTCKRKPHSTGKHHDRGLDWSL